MIRVAGVGVGNEKYITLGVLELIKNTEKVLAFRRVKETLKDIREDIIEVKTRADILENLQGDVLVLASGDPSFYGITDYLKRENVKIDEVIPGISSIQYLSSKLQISWQNANLISLHGRENELKREDVLKKPMIFLCDSKHGANYISKFLSENGIDGMVHAGYNLGYEDEKIISFEVGKEIEEISSLVVVMVE